MAAVQIPFVFLLFFMVYGAVTVVAVIACIYLLLRKGNAFAIDVTPAVRLRRWVVAFFAVTFLSHVWWVVFYVSSFDLHSVGYMLVIVLDIITLLPTAAGMLIYMLQDRRRPFWPVVAAMVPPVVLGAMQAARPEGNYLMMASIYSMVFYLGLTVFMVFSVRQYGRWLRDNYADLEHKEVWQTQLAVMVCLLMFILYWADGGDNMVISYLLQFTILVLYAVLLWRVETLQNLSLGHDLSLKGEESICAHGETSADEPATPLSYRKRAGGEALSNIGQLLADHCVATHLYLQHDLSLTQLVKAVGTNRFYLSQYFSSQGLTYNAYINGLRINYFISRYHELTAEKQPFTAQQLAFECGYRSYSTFSLAFKQRMGKSVTAWMRDTAL